MSHKVEAKLGISCRGPDHNPWVHMVQIIDQHGNDHYFELQKLIEKYLEETRSVYGLDDQSHHFDRLRQLLQFLLHRCSEIEMEILSKGKGVPNCLGTQEVHRFGLN